MCTCQRRTSFLCAIFAVAVGSCYIWSGISGCSSGVTEDQNASARTADSDAVLTAYYFHGTIRCQKCLEIERVSRETVESFYAEELADGRVLWRSVDFDLPENRHFFEDFNLLLPSLALECRTGGIVRRAVLSNTWEKVEVSEELEDYVITGIESFRSGAADLRPVTP